jgi:hypothetical protein
MSKMKSQYMGQAKTEISNRYHFLISSFRPVLCVVCFFLGNSLAYEFYMPTFRNTLFVPSSYADRYDG